MALHTGDPFLASPPLPIEQLSAAVTQRRIKLVTLGYQPIPVLSGRKRPALPRWEEAPTDLGTVSAWADQRPAELSTGIRTRTTPAFDIDIRDAKVADEVEQALRSILPEGACVLKRVGLAPKRLIPMRCVTPFKKILGNVQGARWSRSQSRGARRRSAVRRRGHSRRYQRKR